MYISAPDLAISGYPQLPSDVENPDQVIYDKMDFSDYYFYYFGP
jgi:hypothetical protein